MIGRHHFFSRPHLKKSFGTEAWNYIEYFDIYRIPFALFGQLQILTVVKRFFAIWSRLSPKFSANQVFSFKWGFLVQDSRFIRSPRKFHGLLSEFAETLWFYSIRRADFAELSFCFPFRVFMFFAFLLEFLGVFSIFALRVLNFDDSDVEIAIFQWLLWENAEKFQNITKVSGLAGSQMKMAPPSPQT